MQIEIQIVILTEGNTRNETKQVVINLISF